PDPGEGDYSVTVTDVTSGTCPGTASVSIALPSTAMTAPTASVTPNNPIDCQNDLLRSADVNISAGTELFKIFWNSNLHNGFATSLSTGTHTITGLEPLDQTIRVVDGDGCILDLDLTGFSAGNTPTVTEINAVDPACFDDENGSRTFEIGMTDIDAMSVEVYPIVNYTVDNSSTPPQIHFTDLGDGLHWFRLESSTGECVQANYRVSNGFFFNAWVDDNSQACDGMIPVTLSNGLTPSSLSWNSTSSSSGVLVNATGGAADLVIGYDLPSPSTATCYLTIEDVEFPAPESNISIRPFIVQQPSCPACSDAELEFVIAGGVQAYSSIELIRTNPVTTTPFTVTPQLTANNLPGGTYQLTVTDLNGCTKTSGNIVLCSTCKTSGFIDEGAAEGASAFSEPQVEAFPNPFQSSTEIRFRLPKTADAQLQIFDLQGQMIAELYQDEAEAGKWQRCELKGDDLSAGIYFYRLSTQEKILTGKLIHTPTN
ncbi:MAG: T9SS type A sorting domain-containing protein, partial [Bacteroidota bacterium]